MLRKTIALILIFSMLGCTRSAQAELSYEPYGEDEFPIWTMKLRRAESIFFGSLVLTFPLAMLTWNLLDNFGVVSSDSQLEAFGWQLLIAGGLSLGISTADWIIGEVQGA